MEPWYKVVTLRKEVREGRSFHPDEFAIALEQVVAKTAPEDYSDPMQFFSRTYFTRALREYAGIVLRRLSGRTEKTAPVLTLITQFGGGKTHTLTALYHLVTNGEKASDYPGVPELLREARITSIPSARVGVFVGNAWDPQEGRETPWIDIARQLAGDRGVEMLGTAAKTTPPGTESITRVFDAADAPVLLLFDEVLNFMNRHREMAESFYAFIQNLTVATREIRHSVAVISLPRSQEEMTDTDIRWQEKITKVVRRVAKDLIANDEAEVSEVVRRRLFEDLGNERVRKNVAKEFADWCFERRAQLPPEWTAVDTATAETKAREFLRARFEACYPFHPATLSVFQRKWQALPQYQQTRGTLAMLAQWISIASNEGFRLARKEPLITLGSAPLFDLGFRSTILGQLGEPRLAAAIDADIAGEQAHAKALDADTKGALRDIHRRVGTTILFESSGGQTEKVAHLPELRFALGEPGLDTTSIDNAAYALEDKSYFIRKVGSDGFKIAYQPTLKKVVNDRRASLDDETEIKPAIRRLIKEEFGRAAAIPVVSFPSGSTDVPDRPKLTIVLLDPDTEWTGSGEVRQQISDWTRKCGNLPRRYPAALLWCVKKQGRQLREKVELWLAWKRVAREVEEGTLGGDFHQTERAELKSKVAAAQEDAKEEVWSGYRYVVVADPQEADGLKTIDLGPGHSSSDETLCGRVITALKHAGLLSESVGASYLDRHWPPALKESGAWPLASLRQSFLDGSLTRLLDVDTTLRDKIVGFVQNGDFGLASGQNSDGTYQRVWFQEPVDPDEVVFDSQVFLLKKWKAEKLKGGGPGLAPPAEPVSAIPTTEPTPPPQPEQESTPQVETKTIRLVGSIPPEGWNRVGTVVHKLRDRAGSNLTLAVDLSLTVRGDIVESLRSELRQILAELDLQDKVEIRDT